MSKTVPKVIYVVTYGMYDDYGIDSAHLDYDKAISASKRTSYRNHIAIQHFDAKTGNIIKVENLEDDAKIHS
jgi:hypothetical protein